jgi:hypothetical protein
LRSGEAAGGGVDGGVYGARRLIPSPVVSSAPLFSSTYSGAGPRSRSEGVVSGVEDEIDDKVEATLPLLDRGNDGRKSNRLRSVLGVVDIEGGKREEGLNETKTRGRGIEGSWLLKAEREGR